MKDGVLVKVQEHISNVSVDLSQDHIVFPEPQYLALKKDTHLLTTHEDIEITLSSYTVLFQNISRSHSGNYSMTVSNYELNGIMKVGTFTSNFIINILCEFDKIR